MSFQSDSIQKHVFILTFEYLNLKLGVMLKRSRQVFSGYEETIRILNSLQSNSDNIEQAITNRTCSKLQLTETIKYLTRSGIPLNELDKLSVIHVSGTKGKGSTCALTESILRAHGFKTGVFSSPHLISVTERIRLNGHPISKSNFSQAFWKVLRNLQQYMDHDKDLPAYFKFLTILSLHIFLQEKVDVAIIEVGIGGENDSTNLIRNTVTVGITSIGLDHTNILGDSKEDIAWQKAGIIKENINVFTSVKDQACLEIFQKRADAKNSKLFSVPDINQYITSDSKPFKHELFNKIVQLNGSLAIQLSYDWMTQTRNMSAEALRSTPSTVLSERFVEGLKNCFWEGRYEVIPYKNFRIYLDGAHTLESMIICSEWFQNSQPQRILKILIFNVTGDRNSKQLLSVLCSRNTFQLICFVPNIPLTIIETCDNYLPSTSEQIKCLRFHASGWDQIIKSREKSVKMFTNIFECLIYITKLYQNQKVNVLVTGSLHLVGNFKIAFEKLKETKRR